MLSRVSKKLFASISKPATKGYLTEAQVKQYEEDGFLVIKNFLPPNIRDNLIGWANEMEGLPETPGKWMKYFETDKTTGKRLLCRVENFLPFYDELSELSYGMINDMSGELFREPSVIYKEKINFKFPHGNGFTAHQDQPAFVSFGLKTLLTVLLPIDPNTRMSGGLDFAYGLHKPKEIMAQNSDGGIRTDLEARMNWFPIDAAAGDLVFFDSYAPHRSDVNLSTFTRRNLYLTYNPLSEGSFREKYYIMKSEMFPQECERNPNRDYSAGAKVFNVANPINR